MSKSANSSKLDALAELEGAVDRAIDRIRELEEDLETVRTGKSEADELLQKFTGDAEAPARLMQRLGTLEEENQELRQRIEAGHEAVTRVLAKIRFLEDQR